MNKAESLPSRSSPSRGENDRQWPMPAGGKCRNRGLMGATGERAINMQLSNWFVVTHFHFTNRGHLVCLTFRPHLDPLLVGWFALSSQSGNLFCQVPLLGFSPSSPGRLLLTLLGVKYQCPRPPKGFPRSPAGSVPFCLANFLPITRLLFPLILLQRGSHLFCLPSAWQGLD